MVTRTEFTDQFQRETYLKIIEGDIDFFETEEILLEKKLDCVRAKLRELRHLHSNL